MCVILHNSLIRNSLMVVGTGDIIDNIRRSIHCARVPDTLYPCRRGAECNDASCTKNGPMANRNEKLLDRYERGE